MKKSALILLTLFYSSTLLLSSATPALAQTDLDCAAVDVVNIMDASTCQTIKDLFQNNQTDGPWYDQNPNQFAKKVFGGDQQEIFGERYTYAQINWIINSIAAMLNPASGISNPKQLFDFFMAIKKAVAQTQSGQLLAFSDYAKLGPMGLFAGGISALYTNPPASGIQEIKYTASKIFDYTTGAEPAYAQSKGYGFTGLGGDSGGAVRALWTASRNMAYLIMTILLIASGFLIMFRVKINPQTVVSLQTMIPKLIITMILVTFSFAIAGLVIDMIYVFIAAFAGFLSINSSIINNGQLVQTINNLTNRSFLFYIWLQIPLSILLPIIGIPLIAAISIPTMGMAIFLVLLFLFPLILFLITLIKIFVMLIKAYVMLILQIVIAPLQIMLDLIPGQQGFGPWIRNLIANASVFVVVPIMLVLQHVMSGNFLSGPLLNLTTFQNQGGVGLNLPYLGGKLEHGDIIILWLVGFTIFSLTPKIADMIRDALKIPAFKYGSAVGEALGPLKPAVGGYIIPEVQQVLTGPTGPFRQGTAVGNLIERGVKYAQSQKLIP